MNRNLFPIFAMLLTAAVVLLLSVIRHHQRVRRERQLRQLQAVLRFDGTAPSRDPHWASSKRAAS